MLDGPENQLGKLPRSWRLLCLDEIKASEKRALISGPFGSNISAKYFVDSGIPVIRGNNLSLSLSEKFKDTGFVYITKEKAEELNTYAVSGDLLFTAVGTIGQVGLLTGNEIFNKYIISNKQIRLRVDENEILPIFAYYWLASPIVIEMIKQRNTGSSVPLINLSVLKSLPIPVPPLTEQKAIATVLSSLDDKIDLLQRQNKTLEAMTETLFRQWFFEGAREDWQTGPLGEFVDIGIGRTPPRKEHQWFSENANDVKWISIKDLGNDGTYIFKTAEFLTRDAVVRFNVPIIPENTVVLSFKMTVGRVAISSEPMLSNEAIAHFKFRPNTPFTVEFLFMYLKLFRYESLGSTSSIVTAINSAMIKEMEIVIPDPALMLKFDEIVRELFKKIKSNQVQICISENIRDILLPKLMSGEVRVEIS